MTMAEKLLALRTERGMSQDDLAEKLEVSRQSVSKWETGQSIPDLDKIIKLADLFGVKVDELVREGERPQPPEPPQPQVVYVEREKRGLTGTQKAGVVLEVAGAVMIVLGFLGLGFLILIGAAALILGLPLLLSKKHPWLWMGWLAVALSCLVLSPYTSAAPWGLIGGLRQLYFYVKVPAFRYPSTVIGIAVGIIRGTLTLALLVFTGRACGKAWKSKRFPEEK